MCESAAYIPDMSREDSKRARHRQGQDETHQRQRPPLSPGALRARRSRDLQRAGLTVFHVVGHKRRVIAALRAAGWRLAEDASRKEIEHALAEVVSDFTRRWLGREKSVRVARAAPSARLGSGHGPAISP
jgi:hypothetical protein